MITDICCMLSVYGVTPVLRNMHCLLAVLIQCNSSTKGLRLSISQKLFTWELFFVAFLIQFLQDQGRIESMVVKQSN